MKQLRGVAGIILIVLLMSIPVAASEVYMPHLTGGVAVWGDYLTVDNTSLTSATVTVVLYGDTGNLLYSGPHTIPALGESVIDLKLLSSVAQSGKVIYSGGNLNFRLSVLNLTAGGVAEFHLTGAQSFILGFYFSDFASVVDWKGIALANYGATSAAVTLYAIGGGAVLGTASITVAPYSKTSGLHSTWFPSLAMNDVKKIIAVSSVGTVGGIAIASNAASSGILFTAAVPIESFSPGAQTGEFTGTWRGGWVSNAPGYSGDIVGRLVQTGSMVTGTADVSNTDCGDVTEVPVTGTVNEDQIIFNAAYTCGRDVATLAFTQGSRRGDTISGTYQQNLNGSFYDSGTFWLTKD